MMLEREALSPYAPNIQRPLARQKSKPFAPSPLKKQSDYELVAPLSTKKTKAASSRPPPAAPSSTANLPQKPSDPTTPKPIKKDRKKLLCATPPSVLHNTRGKADYDRGKQLGEGGFARCFLVQNKDGELYAAKTVAKKSLTSQKMRSKFFGEIHVHKRMDHPNIVKFIECFEDDENVYMILELCPNKSLMEMLRKRKRFTEPEARYFLLQLLGALKYMHGKRVIHRDLKLGNIFLDEDMNIKIGDFGLAALLINEDERKRTICGTPNYIAPEVLFEGGKNGGGHSYEVDLWGFGVIMYAMLVGKPPFQSTDVDSIYKKIRDNTFAWPDGVTISLPAKSLVNSLLNRDPTARPTLDEIAAHPFFRSGIFPRSIPTSALTLMPNWPGTASSSSAMVASRQEWKKNYELVAKTSGVGFDSRGNHIESTGGRVGQGVSLLSLPASRPSTSASSRAGGDTDVQKTLEKKRQASEHKVVEQAKEAYILPETLSPRDGHARMRNVNVLKSALPSRLANTGRGGPGLFAARQAPPQQPKALVREEADDGGNKIEDEPTVPEPRQLQKQPVRRVSAEPVVAKGSVFPRTRPVTRSHAAVQRAAGVTESVVPNAQALISSQAPRRRQAVDPPQQPVEPQTRPSSFGEKVPILDKADAKRAPPEVIPFEPSYSSRIGVPIPITTKSAIIESLRPFIRNLTAFTSSTLHTLPEQPQSTINAVAAYKNGERNKHVFISKWVDYTNKYGVAYILTDGTCAALFNDNTSFVVDSVGGSEVEFITHSLTEAPQPSRRQDTVSRKLCTDMAVINQKKKSSKGLANKTLMWKRFGNYMKTTLGSEESWNCERGDVVREPSVSSPQAESGMLFVTHYARLKRCAVFRFLDGGFQFNFVDHTKLLLSSGGRTLRLITRQHGLITMSLEEAYEECALSEEETTVGEFGLKTKIIYIKEILKVWARRGKFPADIDYKEGEEYKMAVVLGEGEPSPQT